MRSFLRALVLLFVAAVAAGAQKDSRESLVVSTAWLNDHLKDPGLVILFLGDDNDYNKAHIPGSYNVQWEDFALDPAPSGLGLEMIPFEQLRKSMGSFGVNDGSRVVVYAGPGMHLYATRMLVTLEYAGLGRKAALLDGGLSAWTKESRPTTTDVPARQTSGPAALTMNPIVVNADFVKSRIGAKGISIVDARAAAFYDGVSTGGPKTSPHRAGHIPSAKNVPFSGLFSGETMKPLAELRAAFASAGIADGDTIVGYCHVGLQATAMLFAAKMLGHPIMLYDGSFEEWSKLPPDSHPVAMKG